MRRPVLVLAVLCAAPLALVARVASACGGGSSAQAGALPGPGATDVSPQSSIVLVASSDEVPSGLTLLANGASVPLPAVTSVGRGLAAGGWASFFRMAGPLQPATSYVVQTLTAGGTPVTLTQFSTGSTYGKDPGAPAVLDGLRLWRVHYSPDRVQAGGCVGSEYEGYFALDFMAPIIPGTPADQVVSVLTLSSPKLGTTQSFVFSGLTTLPGGLSPALSGDGVVLPDGEILSAGAALWKPTLEPGMTYCAAIASYGRNDLAAGPAQSNSVCAVAVAVEADGGAGAPSGSAGAGGSPVSGTGGRLFTDDGKSTPTACSLAPGMAGGMPWGLAVVGVACWLARRRTRGAGSGL